MPGTQVSHFKASVFMLGWPAWWRDWLRDWETVSPIRNLITPLFCLLPGLEGFGLWVFGCIVLSVPNAEYKSLS